MMSDAAFAGMKNAGASFPVQYEGGSLRLKPSHSAKAVVAGSEVVFVQHRRQISVPVQSISNISCATDVHRRFGAAVLGLVPRMDLGKVQEHYVGVTWAENSTSPEKGEVLFRLSAAEYRDFVATLERLTGKQAVDTRKTPTVVRYGL